MVQPMNTKDHRISMVIVMETRTMMMMLEPRRWKTRFRSQNTAFLSNYKMPHLITRI